MPPRVDPRRGSETSPHVDHDPTAVDKSGGLWIIVRESMNNHVLFTLTAAPSRSLIPHMRLIGICVLALALNLQVLPAVASDGFFLGGFAKGRQEAEDRRLRREEQQDRRATEKRQPVYSCEKTATINLPNGEILTCRTCCGYAGCRTTCF